LSSILPFPLWFSYVVDPNTSGAHNQIYARSYSLPIAFVDFLEIHLFSSVCGALSLEKTGVVNGIRTTIGATENPNIIFHEKYRWSMTFYALGSTIDRIIDISLLFPVLFPRETLIKK
jgi:hypothetical protein